MTPREEVIQALTTLLKLSSDTDVTRWLNGVSCIYAIYLEKMGGYAPTNGYTQTIPVTNDEVVTALFRAQREMKKEPPA